jgi:hypothetical protein
VAGGRKRRAVGTARPARAGAVVPLGRRARRDGRRLAAALLLLLVVAVPAGAGAPGGSLGPEAERPPGTEMDGWSPEPSTVDERARAPQPTREELAQAYADMRAEAERQDQWRAGDAARGERERSRTSHRGSGRASALGTLREEFPGTAARRPRLLEPPDGYRLRDFLSDRVARLAAVDGGQDVLVESSIPMRARDVAGELRVADLTPVERGAGFEPDNPLVPLRLPRLAGGEIALGKDAFVRAAFEAPGAQPTAVGAIEGGDVFYHEVAADTDLLITPLPTGFETFTQLRSPDSPESFSLRFTLPEGAELRTRPHGGAAIIRDGLELLTLLPPDAVDAQGKRVAATYSVSGSAVEVRTPHRDADLAYPILVDPIAVIPGSGQAVLENWVNDPATWYNDPGLDHIGWRVHSYWSGDGTHYWDRYDWPFVFCTAANCPGYRNGLWVLAYGNSSYPSYTQGEWYYPTWGDVYIPRSEFKLIYHEPNASFVRASIWSGRLGRYTAYKDYASNPWWTEPDYVAISDPAGWREGTSTSINLVLPSPAGSTHYRENGPYAYLGGSKVYFQDRSAPEQPTLAGAPSGWLTTQTGKISASSHDGGLGITAFVMSGAPDDPGDWRVNDCAGDRLDPCPGGVPRNAGDTAYKTRVSSHGDGYEPDDVDDDFDYDAGSWDEGIHTLSFVAIDPTNQWSSPATTPIKIDQTPPEATTSGSLYDGRDPRGDEDHRAARAARARRQVPAERLRRR